MPTSAVWVIITIPRKDYERELKKLKNINNVNNTDTNFNNIKDQDDLIDALKRKNVLEFSMEKILTDALEELNIRNAVWVPTKNGNLFQVYFPCDLYENDSVLRFMQSKGIGTKSETSIGYIPFNMFFYEEDLSDNDVDDSIDDNSEYTLPGDYTKNKFKLNLKKKPLNAFREATRNFLDSVNSRLTVAQVAENVRAGAEVNFDWCCYMFFSAFICCFGLVANDPVNIAASMMVEPIMGTVMAMTFGLVLHDKKLFMLGVRSQIISVIFALVQGYIIGLIFFIWMTEWNPTPGGIWPTPQIQGRGTYYGLIYGVMIALPCGGIIAVTLLNENSTALVGVAVASTFMPPMNNCGMCWAMATHYQIRGLFQYPVPYNISGTIITMKPAHAPQAGYVPVYTYDMRYEMTYLGLVSIALTAVNIVSMLWIACLTLKAKEIIPLHKMASTNQRFFARDIKITREYNDRVSLGNAKDVPLGRRILEEWAEIAGIDKKELFKNTPEARVTQMQTLNDITNDIEADETYQEIMRNAMSRPYAPVVSRQMTKPVIYGSHSTRVRNPSVYNISQNVSQRANGYEVSPEDYDVLESPYSTVTSGRGLRASELIASGRGPERRNSNLLRMSLKRTQHSPYSVWPSSIPRPDYRSDSLANIDSVRRRTAANISTDTHNESTAF